MTIEQLEELGFDRSYETEDGAVRVGCSRCASMVIQGVPCHEAKCPNEARARRVFDEYETDE